MLKQEVERNGAQLRSYTPVLIIDDDPEDRQVLSDLVQGVNPLLHTKTFANGLELVQYLSDLPEEALPLLLFLGLRMPIWDGIRTLKALQLDARYSKIRKYVVSLADTEYEVSLALRCGAKEFIIKPSGGSTFSTFSKKIADAVESIVANHLS